jgi:serine/alanine adding enzyme
MRIVRCDDSLRSVWDHYVQSHEAGWHYHLYAWRRVIERSYRHECPYLMAMNGEACQGILPLCLIKSRLFGSSVTSLPYLDSAGVLASSPEALDALLQAARDLAREARAGYVELRQTMRLSGEHRVDSRKVSLTMGLRPTTDEQWQALPPERRNRVRKAEKAGMVARPIGLQALSDFYAVWSRNMRDLGSPAHGRGFFESVLSEFADQTSLLCIFSESRPVGAALLIEFKRKLAVPWVSSLRSHFHSHPNDLLYWAAMRHAIDRSDEVFDFGRSTEGSGNCTYKLRWGAEPQPLYWHYEGISVSHPELPSDDRLRYRLAVRVWQQLPVWLANRIGPSVRRNLTA